jgi:hypothetical protein
MRRQLSLSVLVALLAGPAAAWGQTSNTIDAGTPAAQLPPPPKDPEARRAWLKARLDEILGAPSLGHTKMSVAVMDPESG